MGDAGEWMWKLMKELGQQVGVTVTEVMESIVQGW